MVYYVPAAADPWNEIVPGLWMGGHLYDPIQKFSSDWLPVDVGDEFDVVISLFTSPGHGPSDGVEHIIDHIEDGELDKDELLRVMALGAQVVNRVRDGKKVLVRCQAGYNRSGLVVALALMEMGHKASDAIDLIREKRSRHALCNDGFVKYIELAEATAG